MLIYPSKEASTFLEIRLKAREQIKIFKNTINGRKRLRTGPTNDEHIISKNQVRKINGSTLGMKSETLKTDSGLKDSRKGFHNQQKKIRRDRITLPQAPFAGKKPFNSPLIRIEK